MCGHAAGHARVRARCIGWLLVFVLTAAGEEARALSQGQGLDTSYTDTDTMPAVDDRHPWLAAGEVMGLNLGIWGYNRYLTREGWSVISMETIRENFRTGFVWDRDGYLMNQFAHPYHGAAYFNAARSNGLTFWESTVYPLGGSLMWELAMENEPPSYNDLVNTPITGITLGEIQYRVAHLLIDESTTGWQRFFRELSAFAVDPVLGLNRLAQGAAWHSGTPTVNPPVAIAISAGGSSVFLDRTVSRQRGYAFLRFELEYGHALAAAEHRNPFEHFVINAELNATRDDNIVAILGSGVLWDTRVRTWSSSTQVMGMYKEIDMIINTIFKLSATSLTGRWQGTTQISEEMELHHAASLSAILMGGTNSEYASADGKDYNLGPGASVRVGARLVLSQALGVEVNYKRFWIHTLSGAIGEEFVGLLNTGVECRTGEYVALGVEFLLYERTGYYRDFPDVASANAAARVYVRVAMD